MRTLVQVRIDSDVVKAVDHVAVDLGLFRNQTMERLLKEALAAYRPEQLAPQAPVREEDER